MTLWFEERPSDSPFVEGVSHGVLEKDVCSQLNAWHVKPLLRRLVARRVPFRLGFTIDPGWVAKSAEDFLSTPGYRCSSPHKSSRACSKVKWTGLTAVKPGVSTSMISPAMGS